ncbi:sugar porter family MFS transporter [Chitinasiproducens palmae]|nr:sugar porter family MFS transporter [Chitinasiproducens palmae]
MSTTTMSTPHAHRRRALVPCYLAALAGLLFGLDIGVISGALPFLSKEFQVSDRMQEWIVSSMMLGAAGGALAAGELSSRYGRKSALLVASVLFLIGSALCAAAWSAHVLIVARLILGLAVGVASFTAPLYLSEISPPALRGSMISLYQLMITVGILAAFLSNTAFSFSGSWRWMLGIVAFPAAVLLCGVVALPSSPRWLMSRGRRTEARHILLRLRGDPADADAELRDIDGVLHVQQRGWALLRHQPAFRRSLALGMLLQVIQQLTGINVVMYYAPRILDLAGFASAQHQIGATVMVGLVNVLATFVAIALVDRSGRKAVLYAGFAIMATGMGALAILFHLGVASRFEQVLAVGMLLLLVAGFAMSAGPLVWVLCSEIQPARGRDFGIAVSTFTNWISNALTGATFLSLINAFGPAATFGGYAVLNAAFIAVVFYLVPETRGVTLEQIEQKLLAGFPLRDIGR